MNRHVLPPTTRIVSPRPARNPIRRNLAFTRPHNSESGREHHLDGKLVSLDEGCGISATRPSPRGRRCLTRLGRPTLSETRWQCRSSQQMHPGLDRSLRSAMRRAPHEQLCPTDSGYRINPKHPQNHELCLDWGERQRSQCSTDRSRIAANLKAISGKKPHTPAPLSPSPARSARKLEGESMGRPRGEPQRRLRGVHVPRVAPWGVRQ